MILIGNPVMGYRILSDTEVLIARLVPREREKAISELISKASKLFQEKPMQVRAKFFVQSITTSKAWNGPGLVGTVHLQPVTSGSEENAAFYAATPGGKIELSTVNDEALKQFKIGDEFYVDFTKA